MRDLFLLDDPVQMRPRNPESVSSMRYDYSKACVAFGFDLKANMSDELRKAVQFLSSN
jgi:nucleoside-diphosphate-sugar epimerase